MLETKSIMSQSAKVVAEYLFVQIPEQVEGLHADIGAFQLALEQTPKVFESVGMHLPVNVFFSMVNNLVLEPLLLESLIGHEGIGVDRTPRFDVSANLSLQSMFFAIADHGGANLTATFQNPHNSGFVFGASLGDAALVFIGVHESGRATDESFVHFDRGTIPAKFKKRTILHCETDAVEHKPCGLLSDAKSTAYFVRTDSVLAVGNHPNSDEPFVEWERGILKDGSNLGAELFASVFPFALPHPASSDESHIVAATSGALDAVGPAPRNHELEAVVRVREVDNCLLESLWFGAHGVPHCQKDTPNALLSQVYYCPYKKLYKC